VRVVADSHAIVWYLQDSKRLSELARSALAEAEGESALVVSVATLIDLWYVTQTTQAVSAAQLEALRKRLESSTAITLEPVTVAIADATISIPRALLTDPWDRMIVATARVLGVALVSRDGEIRGSGLVQTIW
jgi:PIN domain nuclease of toxin-antitoxin system